MYVPIECPKNSNQCLQESPGLDTRWNCNSIRIFCSIDSWAKDARRCCPISCGTGVLTESDCNALEGAHGTCIYPNAAQC